MLLPPRPRFFSLDFHHDIEKISLSPRETKEEAMNGNNGLSDPSIHPPRRAHLL
jgi:hypothetical protein